LTLVEFVFRIAAEQTETELWGLLMQALNQSQQTVRLLHGFATGEGYAFQCMFLARPQQFLSYGINLDFRAMKRMSSRVPAANTPE
jgi:hypothetical protein